LFTSSTTCCDHVYVMLQIRLIITTANVTHFSTIPFARNVCNCCSYFNTSTYDLWHRTPACNFKLHIDNVDIYTFCKAHMLLELLSIRSRTSRFTSETIHHNDLDTFIDFIAMLYYVLCICSCILILFYFLFFKLFQYFFSVFIFYFFFYVFLLYSLSVRFNKRQAVREAATICPHPLQVDLLTLKVVSESRVTWATSVPILVFLGLPVLDLGPVYATDRQTSDAHHR